MNDAEYITATILKDYLKGIEKVTDAQLSGLRDLMQESADANRKEHKDLNDKLIKFEAEFKDFIETSNSKDEELKEEIMLESKKTSKKFTLIYGIALGVIYFSAIIYGLIRIL